MLRKLALFLSLCLLLLPASTALALYTEFKTEEFGPAVDSGMPGPWKRPADMRSAIGRRYWSHTGWDGWGQVHEESTVACQGNVEAVNQALAAFAKIPADEKQIRLFPAPGAVRSLNGKTTVPCDWHIQWMSHTSFPRGERNTTTQRQTALMTVYIARTEPIGDLDPRAADWIKDLDDSRFAVRQRAFQMLADQREAALPLLQLNIKQAASIEQRMRLEQLLARLDAIHVRRLVLPKGIAVTCLDALMDEEQKNWHSGNYGKSWQAACNICAWAEHTDAALPLLVQILLDDRVQARELALDAFARLGKRAASVVPDLQAAQRQAPAARRECIRQALSSVVQSSDIAGVEEGWRRNRELRKGIASFCSGT